MSSFDRGVAFIFEGTTERVFYQSILEHYVSKHDGFTLTKEADSSNNDYRQILSNGNLNIIIKTFTVGTIIASTQVSANWFRNSCRQRYNQIDWTVFLCYDTDAHNKDISQFKEGDWKHLKNNIRRNKRTHIIDLAASADIEDIMLYDLAGICKFLGISLCSMPSGRKGKSKIKKIFRENGSTYHEGERAKALIDPLEKDIIIRDSSVPFHEIDNIFFK